MVTVMKKTLALCSLLLITTVFYTGCSKKATYPGCRQDSDCKADAMGRKMNGVCVMSQCQECNKDSDCPSLEQCINHQCLSSCKADKDCQTGEHCEKNFCIADSNLGRDGEFGSFRPEGCENVGLVHFEFDSYAITQEGTKMVESLASCLKNHPEYSISIGGHADDRGTPSYNLGLGERRGNAVRQALVQKHGIEAKRLTVVSFGSERPLVDGKNETAWAKNRRTDFDFLGAGRKNAGLQENNMDNDNGIN
jgi:peptidoglycan-associated lipoprotein